MDKTIGATREKVTINSLIRECKDRVIQANDSKSFHEGEANAYGIMLYRLELLKEDLEVKDE